MRSDKIYRSKVDWWLGLLIVLLFTSGIASLGVSIYFYCTSGEIMWWLLASGVFILLLIIGLVWPLNYVLLNDTLLIRFGFFRSRLKYEIITSIKPTRNPLSSPALSLDRLEINYKGNFGFLMISPKDKEAFMKEIASRTTHLEYIDGEVQEKR